MIYEVNQGSCPGEMDYSTHFPSSLLGESAKKAKTVQWGRKKTCSGDTKKVEVNESAKCNQKLSEMRSEIYPLDFLTRRLLTTLERTSSLDMEIEDS